MIGTGLGGFGNKRLACVGGKLLDAMQRHRTLCVHRLAKGRNQTLQFNRFLANPAVTTHEMLATAGRLTGQRVGGRHVLALQDTTELHFPSHEASKRGFGKRGQRRGSRSVPASGVLAIDAANAGVIGLVDCVVLNRTAEQGGGPQAAGCGRQGVAPLAAWRGGCRRPTGGCGDDHRGGGPRERHLRPVRPATGRSPSAVPVGARPASCWKAVCCPSTVPPGRTRTARPSACRPAAPADPHERPRLPWQIWSGHAEAAACARPANCRRRWRCGAWMFARSTRRLVKSQFTTGDC